MKCADCIFAYTNSTDEQDVYSCPFSFQETFHSNEKCHYPKAYITTLQKLRPKLNLYKHIQTAIIETLDEN